MKKSFYENMLFSKGAFLLLYLLGCGVCRGSEVVDYATVYSVNLRNMKIDSQVIVDVGDSTTNIVKNISDSCQLMLYKHRDSLSRVETIRYGENGTGSCYFSQTMQGTRIFKVDDGFMSFASGSQRGCYFSDTGVGEWSYVGRLGMDYCMTDCVCEVARNDWVVYYHHTFEDELPDGASYAFASLELEQGEVKPLSRRIEIKHNNISFDRLKVVRVTRRGYYSYFAFMQRESSGVYMSFMEDGRWSYPLEFIAGQAVNLIDAMVVKDRIHLLLLRRNRLELVKIVLHGDSYKIKDTTELMSIVSSDYKYVSGFFVDKSRAMVIAR